jgi:hypothetical protein
MREEDAKREGPGLLSSPSPSLLKLFSDESFDLPGAIYLSTAQERTWLHSCSHTSGGGRGADGNMIGMSIAVIRPKGNHHIGSEAADDLADQDVLVNLIDNREEEIML